MPASLVVAVHAGVVLMMFDRRRQQRELPGGMRATGESPRRAAARELAEETGIHGVALTFATVAEFALTRPARRELLAVYRTDLGAAPRLSPSEEGLGFRWWPPGEPGARTRARWTRRSPRGSSPESAERGFPERARSGAGADTVGRKPEQGGRVPRPERPLDPGDDPLTGFAADLRRLRESAGNPTYRELGRRAHFRPGRFRRPPAGGSSPAWP